MELLLMPFFKRILNFELIGLTQDELREEGIEDDDPLATPENIKEEK